MKVPAGHQTVMPYLILNDAKGFMEFTKEVFNAKVTHEDYHDSGILRHGEIQIGNSTIMFGNVLPEWGSAPAGLFVYVENADETYNLALKHGAIKIMEPADHPYGRSCGVKDANENTWWITSL
ncbi:VOC family protein [Chitinophaga silvatica]|uniref:VOC family protein n=1 Tax=Chitinophaga silvatica TaxID=2282649 RepID=A0A3E1Y6D2_9BACT|nr:VOC family protein [Chitinophaga silvatica]RFS20471.1 VOC family protein [Chitinophaga silvatica]